MIKNNILYSITSFVSSRLFAMIHRMWIIRIFFFFSLTLTINVWANIVRWRSRRPLWTNDTISREKWIVFIITILITIVQSTSLFAQMLLCFILQFYFLSRKRQTQRRVMKTYERHQDWHSQANPTYVHWHILYKPFINDCISEIEIDVIVV